MDQSASRDPGGLQVNPDFRALQAIRDLLGMMDLLAHLGCQGVMELRGSPDTLLHPASRATQGSRVHQGRQDPRGIQVMSLLRTQDRKETLACQGHRAEWAPLDLLGPQDSLAPLEILGVRDCRALQGFRDPKELWA